MYTLVIKHRRAGRYGRAQCPFDVIKSGAVIYIVGNTVYTRVVITAIRGVRGRRERKTISNLATLILLGIIVFSSPSRHAAPVARRAIKQESSDSVVRTLHTGCSSRSGFYRRTLKVIRDRGISRP